ncbi:FtsX-like permease family protein [Betaproteobacteria bacterium LSUCC0115]|jgi:ABC-type antimicrobial peptide transport system permease subunit|nr:FtsX-like permease family protein [Burkholderiales bacterium LSUCC0115]
MIWSAIPIQYSLRNLWVRKTTTLLTALGMALVVYVFAAVLMLEAGLRNTLVNTGEADNMVVTRQGTATEVQSSIDPLQASIVASLPEVASRIEPLASYETVVLVNLDKRETGRPSNLVIRGLNEAGRELRRQVTLVSGRAPRPGTDEVMAGLAASRQFVGLELGGSVRFAGRDWPVVGVFDGGGSGFDSELWADADVLRQSFRRASYSSVIVRLLDPTKAQAFADRVREDPRLPLQAKSEREFYAEQSETLSRFIKILGLTLTVIFSIGAVIGATITMQSAVATRVAEIGTLRALGFARQAILLAFLAEAIALSLVGGAIGLGLASLMQAIEFSTTNFQSFSELSFGFLLTPGIVIQALVFSILMGTVGGMLPAIRASRIAIVEALRAA